jgi:magnesium transporter
LVIHKIFEFLSPQEVGEFFEQLEIDDEAYEDLFDTMNAQCNRCLISLASSRFINVSKLATFGFESSFNISTEEALMLVKEQAPDAETIYVIFAINTDGQLVGVLSHFLSYIFLVICYINANHTLTHYILYICIIFSYN